MLHLLPDGTLTRPVPVPKRFINDQDRLGILIIVGREASPFQNGDTHGREVSFIDSVDHNDRSLTLRDLIPLRFTSMSLGRQAERNVQCHTDRFHPRQGYQAALQIVEKTPSLLLTVPLHGQVE